MKSLKKVIRLVCLIMFIILASVGVGISGAVGAPVNRRPENEVVTIEMVDAAGEENTVSSEEYKP
ncbi:MAG TPA: hypothetical protein VGN20_21985 [Mucilaginibacter sp.]|jgi:hypothetical protein